MLERSEPYHAAITGDVRRILLRAVIDIISPDIVYGTAGSSGEAAFSMPEQIHDRFLHLLRRMPRWREAAGGWTGPSG